MLNIDIRFANQIPLLSTFAQKSVGGGCSFDDDIGLSVYLDFKRESQETLSKLLQAISNCTLIKHLTIDGSPNTFFTDGLFSMMQQNESIRKL